MRERRREARRDVSDAAAACECRDSVPADGRLGFPSASEKWRVDSLLRCPGVTWLLFHGCSPGLGIGLRSVHMGPDLLPVPVSVVRVGLFGLL